MIARGWVIIEGERAFYKLNPGGLQVVTPRPTLVPSPTRRSPKQIEGDIFPVQNLHSYEYDWMDRMTLFEIWVYSTVCSAS